MRLSYSNVMSTIAVFAALGGTSYAAVKISGKDVRDASLTGRDVKDRSLRTRDIRRSDLRRLTAGLTARAGSDGLPGPQGPAGPAGPAGAQGPARVPGPQGERGSAAAGALPRAAWRFGPNIAFMHTAFGEIVSVPLPAGKWHVTATGLVENRDGATREVTCKIDAGNVPVHVGPVMRIPATGAVRQQMALQAMVDLDQPASVKLMCAITGSIPGEVRNADLTAVEVGSIDLP